MGIGWLEEEFRFLGVPFEDRVQRTEDYVGALRALWGDEVASYSAGTVAFDRVISRPRPASGTVPIVIGGHTRAAARRAGRIGDGFWPAKGDLPALIEEMRKAAEDAGRDPGAVEITAGLAVMGGGQAALDEVGRLAELGVSRVMLAPLTYDPSAVGDVLAAYGADVIARV